jgi:hypothetical protein
MKADLGVGPTPDLSLRVSVATLVRVVFSHPLNGMSMLALEQKATRRETEHGGVVDVMAQPFGGAVRILDLEALQALIGDFHLDSPRARAEQDFRLFIRGSSWPVVREFCIQHLSRSDDPILETDPARELAEEFHDALATDLQPGQYSSVPVATVVENGAAPTANIHARGYSTVRLYRIFEATISDASLAHSMLNNSERYSEQDLRQLAWDDFQKGGKGRANAVLALPLKQLSDWYPGMPPEERNAPVLFEEHHLNETVAAVLDGMRVPKYQRL